MDLSFHEKLGKIQQELNVPKNQKNKFGGYMYRSLEDIMEAVKPLLETYGLTLFFSDEVIASDTTNSRYPTSVKVDKD